MAQECGFFNAQLVGEEYDRVYLAEQFAAYFASFIGNGVFGKSMQKLEVVAQSSPDMSVKVLSGEAWINGWWYRNTDEYTLSLDVADGVLDRIDAIVLRWGNQERNIWLQVIKGSASTNPVVPNIRRDADYYDLQLATVSVSKGSINITQSAVNDTRLVTSVCGLVTGVVDQIDTTGLYAQFEQYFEEFKEYYEKNYADWTEQKQGEYDAWIGEQEQNFDDWYGIQTKAFDDWFASLQDKLSGDVASNLQMQIEDLQNDLDDIGIATTEKPGLVKPDGSTITVSEDGTIVGAASGFTGTTNEVNQAVSSGEIKEGMIVNVTDDYNEQGGNSGSNDAYLLQGGTEIPAGADLKSEAYLVPGNYYCQADVIAATLVNSPLEYAFTLKVESSTGVGINYITQTFVGYSDLKTVKRTHVLNGDVWGKEKTIVTSSDLSWKKFNAYDIPSVATNSPDTVNIDLSSISANEILIEYGNKDVNSVYGGGALVIPKIGGIHPKILPIYINSNRFIGTFYAFLYDANTLKLSYSGNVENATPARCIIYYR